MLGLKGHMQNRDGQELGETDAAVHLHGVCVCVCQVHLHSQVHLHGVSVCVSQQIVPGRNTLAKL